MLMVTPENAESDLARISSACGQANRPMVCFPFPTVRAPRACSIREAMIAPQDLVPAARSIGRICGAPTVACPPAIPVAVSGEVITEEAVEVFARCGVTSVSVVCR